MEKQHDTAFDFSGDGAKKGSSGKHQSALLNIGAVHTHFGHVQVSSPHLHHTLWSLHSLRIHFSVTAYSRLRRDLN